MPVPSSVILSSGGKGRESLSPSPSLFSAEISGNRRRRKVPPFPPPPGKDISLLVPPTAEGEGDGGEKGAFLLKKLEKGKKERGVPSNIDGHGGGQKRVNLIDKEASKFRVFGPQEGERG